MATDERTSGIVLRIRPLTETSLIIHWLTPEFGRLATVAKGARRAKSPFRGKLDLFFLAEFTFSRSRRSELHNLREVTVRDTHAALRSDIGYIQQVSYGAALIEQATETETPLPEIFSLFEGFLRHLTKRPPTAATIFAFELKLLDLLGLAPELDDAALSEGSKQLVRRFLEFDWSSLAAIVLSAAQSEELRSFLQRFIEFHLERLPKGRAAALHAGTM